MRPGSPPISASDAYAAHREVAEHPDFVGPGYRVLPPSQEVVGHGVEVVEGSVGVGEDVPVAEVVIGREAPHVTTFGWAERGTDPHCGHHVPAVSPDHG